MDKHDAGWRQQPVTKTNWQKVSEFITPTHPREHSRRMHQDRPVAGGPFHWCGNRRVKGREIPNKTQDARLAQSHVKVADDEGKDGESKKFAQPKSNCRCQSSVPHFSGELEKQIDMSLPPVQGQPAVA